MIGRSSTATGTGTGERPALTALENAIAALYEAREILGTLRDYNRYTGGPPVAQRHTEAALHRVIRAMHYLGITHSETTEGKNRE